jgi:hypothetical protein
MFPHAQAIILQQPDQIFNTKQILIKHSPPRCGIQNPNFSEKFGRGLIGGKAEHTTEPATESIRWAPPSEWAAPALVRHRRRLLAPSIEHPFIVISACFLLTFWWAYALSKQARDDLQPEKLAESKNCPGRVHKKNIPMKY